MNMSIDEIKDICVQITINGVHISQKIKSNHCMMTVLASAQIDNILSKEKNGDHDYDNDKDIIIGRIKIIECELKQIKGLL
jgi:hypothetical protein